MTALPPIPWFCPKLLGSLISHVIEGVRRVKEISHQSNR